MEEIWRDIPWYEWLYKISSIWNLKNNHRLLKPYQRRDLYFICRISKNKNIRTYLIHRLVASAFLWLDLNNSKICACHKDDDPANNSKDNLFLWTQKENMIDCWKKWRVYLSGKDWKNHPRSKKIKQFSLSWWLIKIWYGSWEVQRELWLYQWNIIQCCKWNRKSCWGYKWNYM